MRTASDSSSITGGTVMSTAPDGAISVLFMRTSLRKHCGSMMSHCAAHTLYDTWVRQELHTTWKKNVPSADGDLDHHVVRHAGPGLHSDLLAREIGLIPYLGGVVAGRGHLPFPIGCTARYIHGDLFALARTECEEVLLSVWREED